MGILIKDIDHIDDPAVPAALGLAVLCFLEVFAGNIMIDTVNGEENA